MIAQTEMASVLSRVESWPVEDRIALAQKIIESVHPKSPRRPRGRSADEVIQSFNMPQPAPSDFECQQILEEELLRKYGK